MPTIINGTSDAITFPDSTIQNTSAIASGKIPKSLMPSGSVIQTVSGVDNTAYSTTTSVTTSTFSITLSNSSNKVAVYLWGIFEASIGSTVPGPFIRLVRSGTNLSNPSGFYVVTNNGQPNYLSSVLPIMFLDTPATVTPSYSISLSKASGGGTNTAFQVSLNWILMEIAA
jgi:hypothetical protein